MCGIVGIFDSRNKISDYELDRMSKSIIHRGPDAYGTWLNDEKNVTLGHRRLSIIDLTVTGNQPMISYNSRYVIVFNGEIYNYLELANYLRKKGHNQKYENDTRVLLEGYSLYGEEFLQQLDGMYAFAIFDRLEKSLFCARDRFGEKPFFYTVQNGCFYFSSEIKSFWAINIRKQIREEALFDFAYSNSVTDQDNIGLTFFENIYKIKPGNCMKISANDGEVYIEDKKYWSLNKIQKNSLTYLESKEKLENLIESSIKLRLRSDVEVGISLSGGIDSSVIAAILSKKLGIKEINSFSARFNNYEKDEGKNISIILEKTGLSNFSVYPTDDDLIRDFDELCYHHDEPFRSTNMYAQYRVMSLAAKHGVKVLINGQGADEIFAGYYLHREAYYRQIKNESEDLFKLAIRNDQLLFGEANNKSISSLLIKYAPQFAQKVSAFKEFLNGQKYNKNFQEDFIIRNNHRIKKRPQLSSLQDFMLLHINSGLLEELV
jgi:asparagine synthase (glutamine-hydrolysing)